MSCVMSCSSGVQPTNAQCICPLLEAHFHWEVLFGAHGLSIVRNLEVVRYLGAVNVLRLRE